MTSDDTGAAGGELRRVDAEGIRHLAAGRGVDLTGDSAATLGFLLGLAATVRAAEQLSPADRNLHAEITFELMQLLVDEDAPGFAGGWNLGVDISTVVASASAAARELSEQGLRDLKLNAARLSKGVAKPV